MATSDQIKSVDLVRTQAIESALGLRQEMSLVLKQVANNELSLADVLINNSKHQPANRLYLVKVLELISGIGKVKARRIMAELGIAEKCRIESLSAEDRESLLRSVGSPV
jgi:predicted flap endonuclease-1-like 5' DNA nuclease